MSFTPLVSQLLMCPYKNRALPESLHHALTAVRSVDVFSGANVFVGAGVAVGAEVVGIIVGAGSTQIHSEFAFTPQEPPAVLKYTFTEL